MHNSATYPYKLGQANKITWMTEIFQHLFSIGWESNDVITTILFNFIFYLVMNVLRMHTLFHREK